MPTCARPLPRSASRRSKTPLRSSPRKRGPSLRIWLPAFAGMNGVLPLSRASALRGAEPIETLLLLVAQRSVELLERRLDGLIRAQHRIKPLLHRLQAADRRKRPGGGAIRVQQIDRLGRGVLQLLERAALRPIGLHRAFDPLQRQACDARCALAADLRQAALSLLLVRIVGAE